MLDLDTEAGKKHSMDSGEGVEQGSSSYLTIIRGEDSPREDGTRRAKTMEPLVYKAPIKPPIPTHSSRSVGHVTCRTPRILV